MTFFFTHSGLRLRGLDVEFVGSVDGVFGGLTALPGGLEGAGDRKRKTRGLDAGSEAEGGVAEEGEASWWEHGERYQCRGTRFDCDAIAAWVFRTWSQLVGPLLLYAMLSL